MIHPHLALVFGLYPNKVSVSPQFNFNMWATVVNRQGSVCAVVYSGPTWTAQWTGSRAISAQKANTGNLFCLHDFALSTANLFAPVQPGGSLYGRPSLQVCLF